MFRYYDFKVEIGEVESLIQILTDSCSFSSSWFLALGGLRNWWAVLERERREGKKRQGTG